MTAFNIWEDGQQWLRIVDDAGFESDEPITGWTLVLDLTNGKRFWRHADGRNIRSI